MKLNQSLFQEIIQDFATRKDKNGNNLNMDYLTITQDDHTFYHEFNNEHEKNDLRSLCKPIISLSLGIAIENGLIWKGEPVTLETKIFPLIKDLVTVTNESNLVKWEKVTLKHVLTHSIGFADGLLFSKDIKDKDLNQLLDFIVNYDITYEPGTHFVYSNVGPYLISVIIQEELGVNLSEWVNNILFKKLNITKFEWKNYGKYCAGATGLKLNHNDLHTIGLVLLNGGKFNGEQLVSAEWIKLMTSLQIETPLMYDEKRVFPKFGYGFFVYICKNGNFYIDGTDGQYIIVIPKDNILITTMGHQPDMKPITECLRKLLD